MSRFEDTGNDPIYRSFRGRLVEYRCGTLQNDLPSEGRDRFVHTIPMPEPVDSKEGPVETSLHLSVEAQTAKPTHTCIRIRRMVGLAFPRDAQSAVPN